ncbi:MAG TPA: guanylate kinase [Pyrinomonadaceae bacterium]|nr:guanylate kinase [Pyrinomonadaceae bacterium]
MKGSLIIISSPSGGGKGTLIKEVLKTVPNVGYSVSYTTRERRSGETDGRDYFFIGAAEFNELIDKGEFLEYAEVHGNFYGTSVNQVLAEINLGRDVILEIDVQGAQNVRAKIPEAVSIFILPPSFEVLRQRLVARKTEKKEDLELRLHNSFDEVGRFNDFEYIIINDEVSNAAKNLQSVILAERMRRIRQTESIEVILDSFDASITDALGE